MKRVLGLLVGASLAIAIGCAQSYDLRLEKTLENIKYQRDLDRNTEAPPANSNLQNAHIYLRAPKGLKGPAKTFAFVVEPGKFDVADTFFDQDKQASLHILARVPTPKKAPAKKAAGAEGAEAPAAARGDFITDVLDFLKTTYSQDVSPAQLKSYEPNSHGGKSVSYAKSATLDLGEKSARVFFFGDKNSPAQVALIYEGPKDAIKNLVTQIDYSLNSLVVGNRATALYTGQEELSGEEGAVAGPAVF